MDDKKIKEYTQLARHYQRVDDRYLCGVDVNCRCCGRNPGKPTVHLLQEGYFKLFPSKVDDPENHLTTRYHCDNEYEVWRMVDGVEFFALLTQKELDQRREQEA